MMVRSYFEEASNIYRMNSITLESSSKRKRSSCQPRWSRGNVSPRDSRFAGSNPVEVDGFFQDVVFREGLEAGVLESEISGSLKNLKLEKNRHMNKI